MYSSWHWWRAGLGTGGVSSELGMRQCNSSCRGRRIGLTTVGVDGSDGSHGAREVRPAGAFPCRALPGVDGSDASHGMWEMRPAGTSARARAGVDGWDASHGMCEARTAGTLICLILRSGAIHSSDEAPLLKKLSCTAALLYQSLQGALQSDARFPDLTHPELMVGCEQPWCFSLPLHCRYVSTNDHQDPTHPSHSPFFRQKLML